MTAPDTHNLLERFRSYNRPLREHEAWVQRPSERARLIVIDLLLISVIVTVTMILALRLWDAHFRVPFFYATDGLGNASSAKNIVETGWMQTTQRLGAPFGQQLYDYPISGDNGNFLIVRMMAIFTNDWALILNTFVLLTFYTTTWSAYLSLRWLRCGRTSSIVCALLFGFAPYHFGQASGHWFLSSYFVLPIGVLLAVRASSGRPFFARMPVMGKEVSWRARARFHVGSTLPWVVMCLACGSFGPYYMFFTIITIVMATLVIASTQRTLRPLFAAGSYCALIGGMFLFNILPNLLYRARHGVDPLVASRVPIELDLYALRLVQLLTPLPGHWFGPLRSVSEDLRKGYSSETTQFFGLVGAAALLLMFAWMAAVVARPDGSRKHDVRALLGIVTMAWILIATTGGLDWFATLVGFSQIRTWNRVSILLFFTTLAWLAMTVAPKIRRWVGDSTVRRYVGGGLAIAVLAVGLVDQASGKFYPDPNVFVTSFASDKAFFASIEQQLPKAAMVYQLPYRRFPEELPLLGSMDYDLLRPYLHTQSLRWSYGGMKGRESEWQARLAGLNAEQLTRDVLAVGFQAYVIDREGYPDHGAALESEIGAAIGRPASQSSDGRWSFFDLTGLSTQFGSASDMAALRESLLYTPRVEVQGCSPTEGSGTEQFNWCTTGGSFHVIDTIPNGRPTVLRASVIAPGGTGTLRTAVAGVTSEVVIGPDPTPITVTVPPGSDVAVEFSTDVPALKADGDSRDLRFEFVFPQVTRAP